MRFIVFVILFSIATFQIQASEKNLFLSCSFEHKELKYVWNFESATTAQLQIRNSKNKLIQTCFLETHDFDYSPDAQRPRVDISVKISSCDPGLSPKQEKEFVTDVKFVGFPSAEKQLSLFVQWNRSIDPSSCHSSFNEDLLSAEAKLFSRKPASIKKGSPGNP